MASLQVSPRSQAGVGTINLASQKKEHVRSDDSYKQGTNNMSNQENKHQNLPDNVH